MRSYRDAILETIRLTLLDMKAGEPSSDPYAYQFSEVTRSNDLPPSKTKRLVGNVQPGDEMKTMDLYYNHCFLPVIIDYAFTVNTGDPKPSELIEILLADIQRRLYQDRTFNGLALDTKEEGNSAQLSSENDKLILGSLYVNVFYRHDLDDPRKYMGEWPSDPEPTKEKIP